MRTEPTAIAARSKPKVFLVDDHPILRQAFAQLLNETAELLVCGQAGSATPALKDIEKLKPDLVIADIDLTGTNGIELIKRLKALGASTRILVFSAQDEELYSERALRAGANGYVMKQAASAEVMTAIRKVARGGRYLSRSMQERMLERLSSGKASEASAGVDLQHLSDRELEVFQLIGKGSGTREIAEQLHLSVKTVETYRAHLKEKLKLRHGMQLIRLAVEMAGRAEAQASSQRARRENLGVSPSLKSGDS